MLTACQPTPEKNIVINKNNKQFEKLIKITAQPNQKIEYPLSFKDNFMSKDNRVNITIDANVNVPSVEKFPIFKINPIPITHDIVELAVEHFMQEDNGYYPRNTLTKSEIESEIIRIKSTLSDKDKIMEICGDTETYDIAIENYNSILKEYEERLISAPDAVDNIPTNLVFRPLEFYETDYSQATTELAMTDDEIKKRLSERKENLYLISDTKLSNGKFARLRISSEYKDSHIAGSSLGEERYEMRFIKSFSPLNVNNLLGDPFEDCDPNGTITELYPILNLTEKEALEMAHDSIRKFKVGQFYLSNSTVEKQPPTYKEWQQISGYLGDNKNSTTTYQEVMASKPIKFYIFEFRPKYNNIPILLANNEFITNDFYIPPLASQKIVIRVSNDGIVDFKWTNPISKTEMINENARILSFDKILDKAKEYMKIKYNLITIARINQECKNIKDELDKYNIAEVRIDEIKLGLTRIPVFDKVGDHIMIPVWNFYGQYSTNTKDNSECFNSRKTLFLSINAFDGSIINQKSIGQ
jgi:hypothetical protein